MIDSGLSPIPILHAISSKSQRNFLIKILEDAFIGF